MRAIEWERDNHNDKINISINKQEETKLLRNTLVVKTKGKRRTKQVKGNKIIRIAAVVVLVEATLSNDAAALPPVWWFRAVVKKGKGRDEDQKNNCKNATRTCHDIQQHRDKVKAKRREHLKLHERQREEHLLM